MKISEKQLTSIIEESIKKKLDESLFGKKNKGTANQDVVKPEPAVREPYNGKPLFMHWAYLHPEWDEPLIKKAAELEFEMTNRERPTTPEEEKDIERKVMAEFPFNKSQGDFVSTSSGDLFEQKLRKTIKKMVRESLESFGGLSQFEETDNEKEDAPKKLEKSDSGKADFNNETENEEERRAQVEKFFGQDGVDIAPYAYKLYSVEKREGEDSNDMKNARSKFMKCLNHEPNEAGYPYSFDSSEINSLQSMISSNQLNESGKVKGAIAGAAIGSYCSGVKGAVKGYKIGKEVGKVVDKIGDDIKKDKREEDKDDNKQKKGKKDMATVKINEETLRNMISESIKKVLNEIGDTPKGMYAMSAVQGRAMARRKKAKEAGDEEGVKKQQKTLDTTNNRIGSAIQDLKKKHKKIYGGDFQKADVQGFQYGFEKEKQNGK